MIVVLETPKIHKRGGGGAGRGRHRPLKKPWIPWKPGNLETWDFDQNRVENVHCICLHKTVRDGRKTLNVSIHSASWRAGHTTVLNLRYLHGTSCANNSKFQVFQGFQRWSLEALNTLKTWEFNQDRVVNVHCICLHKTVRGVSKYLNCSIHSASWRACHTTVWN